MKGFIIAILVLLLFAIADTSPAQATEFRAGLGVENASNREVKNGQIEG